MLTTAIAKRLALTVYSVYEGESLRLCACSYKNVKSMVSQSNFYSRFSQFFLNLLQ